MARKPNCPCPKKKCTRHGRCTECAAYHAAKGTPPYCKRSKRSVFSYLKRKA